MNGVLGKLKARYDNMTAMVLWKHLFIQHYFAPGMLQMLMDTELDATQTDYAQTAHASGKDLISLINEVLDQAKIESGRLELEDVPFDLRAVLDNVLSLFSGKSNEKGIEVNV